MYSVVVVVVDAGVDFFAECKTWRCFLDEVRTFFEQNPQ